MTAIMCIAQLCVLRLQTVTPYIGIFHVFGKMKGLFDAHNSRDFQGGAFAAINPFVGFHGKLGSHFTGGNYAGFIDFSQHPWR
jgi:hypothetical protein